jgi:hypothetical protein
MPGYIVKQLQQYNHAAPSTRNQNSTTALHNTPSSQTRLPPFQKMTSSKSSASSGASSIMHKPSTSPSSWPSAQLQANKPKAPNQLKKCKQLLDYLATHPDATVQFHASVMILSIHSNISCLSEANACSWACGHFLMGWQPVALKPIKLNGAFFTLCAILRFVVASAAEAKLGALFLSCKQATIF